MDLGESGNAGRAGRLEGEETVVTMRCMRDKSIFN